MALRVFDFRCPDGHTHEAFVDSEVRVRGCLHPGCFHGATRQIASPRFALDGCSGDFPTAADAWERRRESHMRKERKNMENHDTYR